MGCSTARYRVPIVVGKASGFDPDIKHAVVYDCSNKNLNLYNNVSCIFVIKCHSYPFLPMKLPALFLGLCLFTACQHKKPAASDDVDTTIISTTKSPQKVETQLNTDTLQYIHFEGNFDYWYAVFINAKKDTVQLVVNDAPPAKFRNKLVQVQWFTDTLTEAGDNEAKYASKRLKNIRLADGKPFLPPVTEQAVIKDIMDLPEVKSNADQAGIAERPTDDKEYYLVETGTHEEDKFSRFQMFRVYVYPKYQIKLYDASTETEMSIDEWRQKQQ